MANIQERATTSGEKRFDVRIRMKRYPVQTATFKRKTDALNWIKVTEAAMLEGRHFKTSEAKRRLFSEVIDRYRQDVLPSKTPHQQKVQTTHLNYWDAKLGEFALSNITAAMIAECRDALLKPQNGKALSTTTVGHYLNTLSHCFSIALTEAQT
jgi:hypothetical protein